MHLDELPESGVPTTEQLLDWLAKPIDNPLPEAICHEASLMMRPGMSFIKNLPLNSVVFDVGAGSGTLRGLREWLSFPRLDLKFVGASLEHGEHTHNYEEFFIGDIEQQKPQFQLKPTHVYMEHCIEHLKQPWDFVEWMLSALDDGGGFYISWPSIIMARLPSRTALTDRGYDVSCINFYDDTSHRNILSTKEVTGQLRRLGADVYAAGPIIMPYIADHLKHCGVESKNQYLLTAAIWLKTGCISYIIGSKRKA